MFPTPEAECKHSSNLIDHISMSKERMCQSERGFGVDWQKRQEIGWEHFGSRLPAVQRGKALTHQYVHRGRLADAPLMGMGHLAVRADASTHWSPRPTPFTLSLRPSHNLLT